MQEVGPDAPTVSEVAKKLAGQNLEKGSEESVADIIAQVQEDSLTGNKRRLSRGFFGRPGWPKKGSLVEAQDETRRELTRPGTRALGEHLWRSTPLSLLPSFPSPVPERQTSLVLRTWENTWGTLTGRSSASVENASVDEVVREPRVAPTDSRQPLLPSKNVLPKPRVVTGTIRFPIQTTDLTFLYLVSRGRLTWTNDWLHSTEQGLHAGTNPLYKPPGAARLEGTSCGPLNVLWTTVGDVSVPLHPLIVAPALTTPSFWALSLAPLNSSRSGFYISEKGIRIPLS
jgi:hypothetical protein